MGEHEAVMQLGAPAHQRSMVGLLPEARQQRAHQQLLRERHLRIRRHFEGAHLDDAESPGRRIRRIQFVDAEFRAVRVAGQVGQQVAQDAVDQPGRGDGVVGQTVEGGFQFVDRLEAALVARGACEVGPMNSPENR